MGDEVGIENTKELALGYGQRVVDVACLGAPAAEPPDLVTAEFLGERLHLLRPTIVQNPGAVLALDC